MARPVSLTVNLGSCYHKMYKINQTQTHRALSLGACDHWPRSGFTHCRKFCRSKNFAKISPSGIPFENLPKDPFENFVKVSPSPIHKRRLNIALAAHLGRRIEQRRVLLRMDTGRPCVNNNFAMSWWLEILTSLHSQEKSTNWSRKPNENPCISFAPVRQSDVARSVARKFSIEGICVSAGRLCVCAEGLAILKIHKNSTDCSV